MVLEMVLFLGVGVGVLEHKSIMQEGVVEQAE